jgi:hypothetical protein
MLISREQSFNLSRFTGDLSYKNASFGIFTTMAVKSTLCYTNGIHMIDPKIPGQDDHHTILMDYGRILEKLLTVDYETFKGYLLKKNSALEEDSYQSFNYSIAEGFLLRAQLDAYDDRLPNKTFDIKTRATHAIRYDVKNYHEHVGYHITKLKGVHQSFEREYFGKPIFN